MIAVTPHVTSSGWRLGLAVSYLGREELKRMRMIKARSANKVAPKAVYSGNPVVNVIDETGKVIGKQLADVDQFLPASRRD